MEVIFIKKIYNRLKPIIFTLGYMWKCDKKFLIIKLFNCIITGIYPIINIFFPKVIIDSISASSSFNNILSIISIYFFVQIIYYLIELIIRYYDSINSAILIQYINNEILNKILEVDIAFFEDSNCYDSYQKARNEAGTRAKNTFDQLINFFSKCISLLSVIYILSIFDYKLIIIIVFVIVCIYIISKKSKKISYSYSNSIAKNNRQVGYFYNIMTSKGFSKEIRIFNTGEWLKRKYFTNFEKILNKQKVYLKKTSYLNCINGLLTRLQDAVIYAMLAYITLKNDITIGSFTMYLMATQSLTQNLNSLINIISNLYENSLFTTNLMDFLSIESKVISGSITPQNVDKVLKAKVPILELKNISFHYPGQIVNVINNLSLSVKNNEKLLIVGENGVGKTTLIKLLLRLYDPIDGEITYNGYDIKNLTINEYRKLFSVILQDYNKYAFSIAENVLLSDVDIESELDIKESLTNSGLINKINKLNKGIHTHITREFENEGIDLSIGEMQKLALARAYIRSSPILILDEPTSSLDPKAEAEMYERFINLCEDKTGIFISHRLACAPYMDRIILIKEGYIVEEGDHEELMKKQGIYYDMFTQQGHSYKECV